LTVAHSDVVLRTIHRYSSGMTSTTFSPDLIALVPDWEELFSDGIGDAPVERLFEWGYCHALALAINEATGWPIVGLWSGGRHGGCEHWVVQRPDGILLDVRGAWEPEEMMSRFGYTMDDGWDPASLWGGSRMEDPRDVWELATVVARMILADTEGVRAA
jgi:hypothetical protein